MAAYTTVSSENRGIVGFAPFDMASPGVLPVTIQSLSASTFRLQHSMQSLLDLLILESALHSYQIRIHGLW